MRKARTRAGMAFALASLVAGWACLGRPARETPTLRMEGAAEPEAAGFARADTPRAFVLPDDHGPHFEYQTEWWYYTGNLAAADGRRFGFQLTFFRRGLTPQPPPEGPGLRTSQVYFAHLALTDVKGQRHLFFERWSRGAAGLAGATGKPFAVWLEDWRADSAAADGSAVTLVAADLGVRLRLDLRAAKPLVRHGEDGLSRKSDEPGNASYYIGYTRLQAQGEVEIDGQTVQTEGTAWFDHEWSTSALGRGAVGWDWFSLQTDDRRELMFFQIRRKDGGIEPVSGGTLVEPDGSTSRLGPKDVVVEVLERWTSPVARASYPVRWKVTVPSAGMTLDVDRRLDDQEMRTSFTYWEGAVAVSGSTRGRPVAGAGYVEMTGYAGTMEGVF